jgi:predicted DNA-binding transcriptional regulator
LIGLSLFMLLGFTKAKLPPSPVIQLLTLGIAVVLPMGMGAALIYSQFKPQQTNLKTRRQELQARTIQAAIIKLAIVHGGRLTAVEVIAELGITSEMATQHLTLLTHQNLAELEITESGTLVYAFQDVQALPEKLDAKRIADA